MKTKNQVISIIAILATIFYLIFLIRSTLTPFIISFAIAYFLNPLVNFCTKRYKLSRLSSTAIILGAFAYILMLGFLYILPIIYDQLISLINAIPLYFHTVVNEIYPEISKTLNKAGIKIDPDLSHLLGNEKITSQIADISQSVINNALTSSMTLLNILSIIFIAPILIFYLLKDWDILIAKINDYLPKAISISSRKIAGDIDKTLSGYLRGQFNVCVILALIYASLLTSVGLKFGFLVGFLTGLFSFIPYVGMLCGVTIAIILCLAQWGFDFVNIGIVSMIFIFGQIIESNFLTPKLIGEKIGLHPVWLIFGLFAFGALFGFIGVLFAVPLTAIFGVIIKHFALEYKKRFT